MDPDTPLFLAFALAFFLFIYMMIRSKHKHELAKLDRLGSADADRSLTTTELEDMIRSIVSEATAPMQEQVDQLARRLDSSPTDRLIGPEERVDEPGVESKSIGRKSRA